MSSGERSVVNALSHGAVLHVLCSANNWWLRSGYFNNTNNFANVNNDGSQNNNNANNTNGVVPG